jgi:hypothetical protein
LWKMPPCSPIAVKRSMIWRCWSFVRLPFCTVHGPHARTHRSKRS